MRFEHRIGDKVEEITIKDIELNISGWNYRRLDHKQILIDTTDKTTWLVGLGLLGFMAFLLLIIPADEIFTLIGLVVTAPFYLVGIVLVVYRIIQKPKELILNRLVF